jgi:beta-glucosidase
MSSDAVVAVFGISNMFEGEEGETLSSTSKGDRMDLGLPAHQLEYLKKLRAMSKAPIILVLTGGSPISSPEVYELADAVIFAWYPGQEGGQAVADVIFGDYNPSGRLPITFPKTTSQLPEYSDYSMKGRTYRYMKDKPQFPFGYGLSYASFVYSDIKPSKSPIKKDENLVVSATVKNTGKVAGDEVIQLYITDVKASVIVPQASLKGFKRVTLNPGESTTVSFTITPEMLKIYNDEGKTILEPGDFKITIAGSSPSEQCRKQGIPSVETIINVQ